jgi:hypothetical protein
MTTAAKKLRTVGEFLQFDDGSDTRFELFDGVIVATSPPGDRHRALAGRLAGLPVASDVAALYDGPDLSPHEPRGQPPPASAG